MPQERGKTPKNLYSSEWVFKGATLFSFMSDLGWFYILEQNCQSNLDSNVSISCSNTHQVSPAERGRPGPWTAVLTTLTAGLTPSASTRKTALCSSTTLRAKPKAPTLIWPLRARAQGPTLFTPPPWKLGPTTSWEQVCVRARLTRSSSVSFRVINCYFANGYMCVCVCARVCGRARRLQMGAPAGLPQQTHHAHSVWPERQRPPRWDQLPRHLQVWHQHHTHTHTHKRLHLHNSVCIFYHKPVSQTLRLDTAKQNKKKPDRDVPTEDRLRSTCLIAF